MARGYVTDTGVGKIFLKRSMDTVVYDYSLKDFLIPYMGEKIRDNEFIFNYDLSPPKAVKFQKNGSEKKIPVLDDPADSFFRGIFNKRKQYSLNLEGLKPDVTEVWA